MDWTDDILGISHAHHTLEAEVGTYLCGKCFYSDRELFKFRQVRWVEKCDRSLETYGSIQENQICYPTLFRLAMDILPIQASAVPGEWVFSSSKKTTTQHRSQIKGEHMKEIQVLKFAINHDQHKWYKPGG